MRRILSRKGFIVYMDEIQKKLGGLKIQRVKKC